MNKLIKYTLISFVAFNVLGGTLLGLREYSEDTQAKKAFEKFYSSDTQVLGAYDKKPSNGMSFYFISEVTAFCVVIGGGIIFSLIKRGRLKKSEKTSFDTIAKKHN